MTTCLHTIHGDLVFNRLICAPNLPAEISTHSWLLSTFYSYNLVCVWVKFDVEILLVAVLQCYLTVSIQISLSDISNKLTVRESNNPTILTILISLPNISDNPITP